MEHRVMTFEQVALQAGLYWAVGVALLTAVCLAFRHRKLLYRWLFWPGLIVSGWAVPYLVGQWLMGRTYAWPW